MKEAVEYAIPFFLKISGKDNEELVRDLMESVWKPEFAGTLSEARTRILSDEFDNFLYLKDHDLFLGDLAAGCHESLIDLLCEWETGKVSMSMKDHRNQAEMYVLPGGEEAGARQVLEMARVLFVKLKVSLDMMEKTLDAKINYKERLE